MLNKHPQKELLVPFNFFFTKDEGTAFPLSMAQENNLSLQISLRDVN